ncbi:von Willebrand factor C and EGF domain-containing protein isoform X5 [Corapipo altera]|uniref:von Willebrand factor C and EGF domain-containing protein isoform X5 n=1 Tax=Corapipo altera TaxID=415028 RepID=UPI000FD6B2DB|nr:von Willebrand factor C and EGF domain-containing protein isoform X5 [Corapipo altera]
MGDPTAPLSLWDASHYPSSALAPLSAVCRAGKASRRRRRRRGEKRPGRSFARCGKGGKRGIHSQRLGDPLPYPGATAGMSGLTPLIPGERDKVGMIPEPPWVWGVGGSRWRRSRPAPIPAPIPRRSRIVPGSAGGGGAGPRASGKGGGKAGAGKCWSRLSCWWSCSSRLPVCPCSSPAARPGGIPGGRSREALPWRGAAGGPTFASRAPAADVVPAGCCPRAAGSAPCGITCPDPPGTCGEYGCDLSCNHGGCQEVARVCPIGFSMAETPNGVRCTDIDECQSGACEGPCVNTEGGFVCQCGSGRELSTDRRSCRDMDECQAMPCQHRCENSVGSYRCSCRPGYQLHGNRHSCLDVDECRRPGTRRSCQHNCHNIPGSFRCSCRPGYRLSTDRVSCEGYPKAILAPSPILQSLQHPPTLVLLPPGSHLLPRGSPSPHIPVAAPGTQFPPSSPSLSPGTSIPPSPRCRHRGVSREPGARWTEPGCRSCTCQEGRVLCDAVSCSIPCSHPLPAPAGGCCPTCTGCLHEGVARAEGDVFSPSDGNCSVCICLAGNVSCLSPECPAGSCPSPCHPALLTPPVPAKCSFRGRTYAHGARFSPDGDGCTTCVCQGGEVECSFAPCPILDCPQHQRLLRPGQCCSSCRDPPAPAGCFLEDNGVQFPVGQLWSPGDPCELCICQLSPPAGRRLRELPAHGMPGDLSLSHPDPRAVLPRLLRRLHLHGAGVLQQRDLPVGAGSVSQLHLPGKKQKQNKQTNKKAPGALPGVPNGVSPVSRSWDRWPAHLWNVPSCAPTPSTPRAAAAPSVTTATTAAGRWRTGRASPPRGSPAPAAPASSGR